VLVNHRYSDTTIRIDWAVAAAPPGGGRPLTSVRLAETLELPADDDAPVRFTDPRFGYELTRTAGELRREGLRVSLGAYEARVLWVDTSPRSDTDLTQSERPKRSRRSPTSGSGATRPKSPKRSSRADPTVKTPRRRPSASPAPSPRRD
jgi:hypothetical protein